MPRNPVRDAMSLRPTCVKSISVPLLVRCNPGYWAGILKALTIKNLLVDTVHIGLRMVLPSTFMIFRRDCNEIFVEIIFFENLSSAVANHAAYVCRQSVSNVFSVSSQTEHEPEA